MHAGALRGRLIEGRDNNDALILHADFNANAFEYAFVEIELKN